MGRRSARPRRPRPEEDGELGSDRAVKPNPYHEMLGEVLSHSDAVEAPPVKKRRVGGRLVVQDAPEESRNNVYDSISPETVPDPVSRAQQTAYNDSEDSEDSDVDWEDVDIGTTSRGDAEPDETGVEQKPEELNLVLDREDGTPKRRLTARRKPATAQERKWRLEIHKMNLLCLLYHAYLRNHWCNDEVIQSSLKQLLTKKTMSYLLDDESQSQFQRNRSFIDGIQQAFDSFKQSFTIDARGMARCFWVDDPEKIGESEIPDDIDLPIEKSDFRIVAEKLHASRDVGSQLFAALLRSAGVETRLVCSLQTLPITTAAKGSTPVKARPSMTVAYQETRTGMPSGSSVREYGGSFKKGSKTKKIRESRFPIFWVEALNPAYQKWVPVDPLVTDSIGKPSKFEPPANDIQNSMAYVIAFEEDGSARDVTRRYSQAYNAKTRRLRIESTKHGDKWWKQIMRAFKRLYPLDRDQIEDAELSRREAQEPMPKNIQDFKDHPYYALERHLRRNEVIHPQREVGKVSSGKGSLDSNQNLEPIFRRRDVHLVKSADSWYRLGREIKLSEQPLKTVQSRVQKAAPSEDEDSDDDRNTGTAMYAGFQTCLYRAPPVLRGRVPRNEYGNLDVYTPSMIPPGGAHVHHKEASRAARLLGIDFADAVTGFEFKGRQGTAVMRGAVVAAEYTEAVVEVIRGFGDEKAEAEAQRRSQKALQVWRRLLLGLRIKERIEGYSIEGEDKQHTVQEQLNAMDEDEEVGAGGFLPDRDQAEIVEPVHQSLPKLPDDGINDGMDFELNDFEEPRIIYGPSLSVSENFKTALQPENNSGHRANVNEDGGFLVDEGINSGGFLPDAQAVEAQQSILQTNEQEQGLVVEEMTNASDPLAVENPTDTNPDTSRLEELFADNEGQASPTGKDGQGVPLAPDELRDVNPFPGRIAQKVDDPESDSSDKGSLLSHDPEDEDADPDWLV